MSSQDSSDLALAGLVHDLNNIFETIQEAADLISADSKYAKLAATLRRSATRGSRMLNSYMESSMALLEFESILDSAVEFLSDFLQAARRPAIEVVRRLEPGVRLRGNPSAWERVLVNLFLNAAQAMEEGGTVEVEARRTAEAVEIVVADDGPGISAKILPNIFDAHFSTRAKRSGLGLHIVQSIVRQHGGAVSASNRPAGRGAEFRIALPHVSGAER